MTLVPEECPEEEQVEKSYRMEKETEAPTVEPEGGQSDVEPWWDRFKRIRQPRHVYTYDQLGQLTFHQLTTCPVNVSSPPGTHHDPPARSLVMYQE